MTLADVWYVLCWLWAGLPVVFSSPAVPMMAPKYKDHTMLSTFTIKKADGTTDVTYSLQGSSSDGANYIDTTSNLAAPRVVKVSHSLKPMGASGSDRHSVLAQAVVLDANNVPHTISASLTWTVPRAAVATDILAKDVLAAAVNYLGMANVKDALLDGIIP